MGVLAGLAGLGAAAGIWLIVLGFTSSAAPRAGRPPSRWRDLVRWVMDRRRRTRLIAAGSAGLAVLLASGWPVAALATVAGAYVLPGMVSNRAAARRIERLEALEQWVRRLAEVMGASRGLEATLTDSIRVAPTPIAAPVGLLAERLNNRADTEQALHAFAADLDDPVGDLIATSLILAARRRGPGTRQALASLADAIAREVIVRREVDAERASLRTTLVVIVTSVAMLSALFMASGTLAAPYDTAAGQGVLAAVTGLYGFGLWWMKRLSAITTGTRFLTGHGQPEQSDDPGRFRSGSGEGRVP